MQGIPRDPMADQYLQQKKIPQLFQSLTVALLYSQPGDHIDYLLQRLDEVKAMGTDDVAWNSFLPSGTPTPHQYAQQTAAPDTMASTYHGSMMPGAKQ